MTDTTGMIKHLRALCFLAAVIALGAAVIPAGADTAMADEMTAVNAMAVEAGAVEAMAVENGENGAAVMAQLNTDRLWLPAGLGHMRPLLTTAAERALDNPECVDVLYGRLNEYRSERGEPAFTILCLHDARTTFNLIYLASELEAAQNAPSISAELDHVRSLLQAPRVPTSGAAAAPGTHIQHTPVPVTTTPPEIF